MSNDGHPPSAPLSGAEILRLEQAAVALLAAMSQNLEDETAARRELREFIYFADAGIPIWYCQPYEAQNLSGFESKSSDAEQSDTLPISVLTLDYMFSNSLPGSGGLPLFLSPDHSEELLDQISGRVMPELLTGPETAAELQRQKDDLEFQRKELQDAIRVFRAAAAASAASVDGSADTELSLVFSLVSKLLQGPVLARSFARDRFFELIDTRLIQRVDQYPHLLADVLEGDPWTNTGRDSRVRDWRRVFRTVGTSKSDDALGRDVNTLASIQHLNEAAQRRGVNREFLFITADHEIHKAAELWLSEGTNTFLTKLFVRHPRQYMPLLNLNSAPGRIRIEPQVFRRLHQAIEDLASGFEAGARRGPDTPARAGAPDRSDVAREPRAADLRSKWSAAMRTAALLNVETLAGTTLRALDATVSAIETSLADPTISDLLSATIEAEAAEILRRNRAFTISGILQKLVGGGRGARNRSFNTNPRVPVLFSIAVTRELQRFVEEHTDEPASDIATVLDWLLNAGSAQGSNLIADFEELLIGLNDVEAYALATVVAFRSRAWKSAHHFASSCESALSRLESTPKLAEIREEVSYCRRVADRFLLDDLATFQQLREEWRVAFLKERDSRFRRARAASELAAASLVFVFKDRFVNQEAGRVPYAREVVAEAVRWLDAAASLAAQPPSPHEDRKKWRALEEQIYTNRAAGYVQRATLFGETRTVKADPQAYAALGRLRDFNRTTRGAHVMARLYEVALSLILLDDPQRSRARTTLSALLRDVRREGSLSGPLDSDLERWFASMVVEA